MTEELQKFIDDQKIYRKKMDKNTKDIAVVNNDLETSNKMLDNLIEAFTGKIKSEKGK